MAQSNLPSFPDQISGCYRLDAATNLIISKKEDGQTSKAIDGSQQTLAL